MHRTFDATRDREATRRIWREIGWLDPGVENDEVVDGWVDAGRALVADINGEAECLVCTAPGTLAHQSELLPGSMVTGVTTSLVARKQGLALKLTAAAVVQDVQEGAIVAALGMFDQGFYNRVGFGSGGYEHTVTFDPAQLSVKTCHRPPLRFTLADYEAIHAARLARPAIHGSCRVLPLIATQGPMKETKGFGLGYRDSDTGEITHHFWCKPKGERGPYRVVWIVYHNRDQFLELMSVIKSIGDQVRAFSIVEPAGIQLQDLMLQPFKQGQISGGSSYAAGIKSCASFQYRICDLAACMEKTSLGGQDVRFNLNLSDPIEGLLPPDSAWRGCGGNYIVTLGERCSAARGVDSRLATLQASVGAFTRLWLGVLPASGLALTDELDGPAELIQQLDRTIRLPVPLNDWYF